MANQEERIIIAVAEPSLLEGGADKIYPCISKQEAIEVIKKSLKQIQCWPNSFNDSIAEAALNALLKGVKK